MGNKDIVPFTFVPFIVGPRRCLGKNFAILEMKVFISIWLSRLTFQKLTESEEDILTEQSLLVRILDNRVIVRIRQ
jgi:cytochrome P450